MGCSSNPKLNEITANEPQPINKRENYALNDVGHPSLSQKRTFLSRYLLYNFTSTDPNQTLILYTSPINLTNDFFSVITPKKTQKEKGTFKSSNHSIALAYSKGFKVDVVNQDKFFVIIDSDIEIYCLIDGHGPHGHILAQIIQDAFFNFIDQLDKDSFSVNYENSLLTLFEKVNFSIWKRENQEYVKYDPFLSGAVVSIVIKLNNIIYHANVGNTIAYMFNCDKVCPSKYNLIQLSFNDSEFNSETIESGRQMEFNMTPEANIKYLIDPHLINGEIRRIYENGGETRRLSGETKSRIFLKGKYYPGVICSRSLGDQIGNGIGCLSVPHITTYELKRGVNNYLLMCTDGICNVLSHEKMISIIQANDFLLLESLANIVNESKQMFRSHLYSPDMTAILKEFKAKN